MGIESFDAIYASALQVVIVAGANGVCTCDLLVSAVLKFLIVVTAHVFYN